MTYTINKVAKFSGVSTRTLRFYDEIGLLKPAHIGENGYRYYEQEQLLLLQQILFFRELGFPLGDIKKAMDSPDFDKLNMLDAHRSSLKSSLARTKALIKTIDKTILHLNGKLIMKDMEMYEGFDPEQQQQHEQYMLEKGILTADQITDSWKQASHWRKGDWGKFKQDGDKLNKAMIKLIEFGHNYDDQEVQVLIKSHFEWVKIFWTPTRKTYTALGQMYLDHDDFTQSYCKTDGNRHHLNDGIDTG